MLQTGHPMTAEYDDDLFEKRARAKQASRDEDERALASGEKTAHELQRENSMFTGLAIRIGKPARYF